MQKYLLLIEKHVEKGLLGVAAAFMLYMLYAFMIGRPYTIDFNGQKVAPTELHGKILDAAQAMDRTVAAAKPEDKAVEKFSDKLAAAQKDGIFADAAVKPLLRRTSEFGPDIVVPGLEESEEASGPIALVTPLRPSAPKVSQGRSAVVPKAVVISDTEQKPGAGAVPPVPAAAVPAAAVSTTPGGGSDVPTVETSWVTVAAYFDVNAQKQEMAKAKYRSHLQKPEIVGVDVERREKLATGEWSEWKAVTPGKAMPQIEIPSPAFNAAGQWLNQAEMNRFRALVRTEQARLMQPPFAEVKNGDKWELPPLPGHETTEGEEGEKPAVRPPPRQPEARQPVRPTQSGGGSVGGPTGTGRGGGGGRFGPSGPATPNVDDKAEGKKRAGEDMKTAKEAMSKKEYSEAAAAAQAVVDNQHATEAQKKDAAQVIEDAQKKMAASNEQGPMVGPGRGPRGGGMVGGAADAGQPKIELVTNPEGAKEPAVWFHDDSVEGGKTYQYRMRVRLWNRYVGNMKALTNPEDARKPVIVGDWSAESDEITVKPRHFFFLASNQLKDNKASVDVWTWNNGKWMKEKYNVGVGDTIGGVKKITLDEIDETTKKKKTQEVSFETGAIVVDLRIVEVQERLGGKAGSFKYAEKQTLVLTYVDPADKQVKERVQIMERNDPNKKHLETLEKS